jgi:hypothetical protein
VKLGQAASKLDKVPPWNNSVGKHMCVHGITTNSILGQHGMHETSTSYPRISLVPAEYRAQAIVVH